MSSAPLPVRKIFQPLPTHTDLTAFVLSILPQHPADVPTRYHIPRHKSYDSSQEPVYDVVLSITPTTGVYNKLQSLSVGRNKAACFLHRPFRLNRKQVPYGSLVLSNHKSFDELLTTGWNVPLAKRLGLDVSRCQVIQGYKDDPTRRIGLVAPLLQRGEMSLKEMLDSIEAEFRDNSIDEGSDVGQLHPALTDTGSVVDTSGEGLLAGLSITKPIRAVAIMNAFGSDEVHRAVASARGAELIAKDAASELLYLTGDAREPGLEEIRRSYKGMHAFCLGHRITEEWGIRYLALRISEEFKNVRVHTVFEDEEAIPSFRQNEIDEVISLSQISSMLLATNPHAANNRNSATKKDSITTQRDTMPPQTLSRSFPAASDSASIGERVTEQNDRSMKRNGPASQSLFRSSSEASGVETERKPAARQDERDVKSDISPSLYPSFRPFVEPKRHDGNNSNNNIKSRVSPQPSDSSFRPFSGASDSDVREVSTRKPKSDKDVNVPETRTSPHRPSSPSSSSFKPFSAT